MLILTSDRFETEFLVKRIINMICMTIVDKPVEKVGNNWSMKDYNVVINVKENEDNRIFRIVSVDGSNKTKMYERGISLLHPMFEYGREVD